jgi:hypothetical protein
VSRIPERVTTWLFWLATGFSALLTLLVIAKLSRTLGVGVDFRATLDEPAKRILHGLNPYPSAATITHSSFPAVYLPPGMLVVTPLTFLPPTWAWLIWDAIMVAVLSIGLWRCHVRDGRVYALTFLTYPSAAALASGNVSMLLAGFVALAWAYRDRRGGVVAVAGSLAIKPVLWPLPVWLVLTDRAARATRAVILAAAAILVGWALIAFHGLSGYPGLLDRDAALQLMNGVFSVHLFVVAGFSSHVAEAIGLVIGSVLVFGSWKWGDDLDILTSCIATALLSSPIVFVHYLLLLVVPLAIRGPSISWHWFALFGLWPIWNAYTPDYTRPTWTVLVAVAVSTILFLGASGWGAGRVESARRLGLSRARVQQHLRS